MLLIGAIEESANMTLAAQTASVKLHRMTLGCHISPTYVVEMRRKAIANADQMFAAMGARKSAPRTLKYRSRRSVNSNAMDRSARP